MTYHIGHILAHLTIEIASGPSGPVAVGNIMHVRITNIDNDGLIEVRRVTYGTTSIVNGAPAQFLYPCDVMRPQVNHKDGCSMFAPIEKIPEAEKAIRQDLLTYFQDRAERFTKLAAACR